MPHRIVRALAAFALAGAMAGGGAAYAAGGHHHHGRRFGPHHYSVANGASGMTGTSGPSGNGNCPGM